jgi:hypothetical protein
MSQSPTSALPDDEVGSALVGALFDAWDELDLVVSEPADKEMVEPWFAGSAFGWTFGHVANSADAWLNVRFQRLLPHPLIGDQHFRFGGDGRIVDWPVVAAGVAAVFAQARQFLAPLVATELDRLIPYDGSIVELRPAGLSLRHAVTVNLVHCHYHIGEIATKRALLGHDVPHLPGPRQRRQFSV